MVKYLREEALGGLNVDKDNQNKEPWNQPIYDDEQPEELVSRRQLKTKPKKGNSLFISMLVVLLLAIAILLVYWFNAKSTNQANQTGDKPIQMQSITSTSSTATTSKTSATTNTSAAAEKAKQAAAEKAKKDAEAKQKEAENKAKEEREKQEQQQQQQNQNNANAEQNQQQQQQPAGSTHVVQAGENLFRISQAYGLTVEQLQALNGLSGNEISVGQTLVVSR